MDLKNLHIDIEILDVYPFVKKNPLYFENLPNVFFYKFI